MASCIPVTYALNHSNAIFTTFGSIGDSTSNKNSAGVDIVKNTLLNAGWSNVAPIQATGGLFYLISVPITGSGNVVFAINWMSQAFYLFDPLNPPAPGIIPTLAIAVPEGSTEILSLTNLCYALAAAFPDWTWSVLNANNIQVQATLALPGTAGNGYGATGEFGASLGTSGGGWTLQSQSVNGVSNMTVSVLDNFGSFDITVTVNGTVVTEAFNGLFGGGTYFLCANEYQFAIFTCDNEVPPQIDPTAAQPALFACVPFLLDSLRAELGYVGFVILAQSGLGGEGYSAQLNKTVNANIGGVAITGNQDYVELPLDSIDPLTTTGGKTISSSSQLALPIPTLTGCRVVGTTFDTFIESAFYPPGSFIEYNGQTWTPLFTQLGSFSGFTNRTSCCVWLAIDGVPTITSGSADGSVGSPFTYQIVATNNPTTYTATGLPPGLSINTSTGAITGTPTTTTSTPVVVTVTATNSSGTSSGTVSITVNTTGLLTGCHWAPTSDFATIKSIGLNFTIATAPDVPTLNATLADAASAGIKLIIGMWPPPYTLNSDQITWTISSEGIAFLNAMAANPSSILAVYVFNEPYYTDPEGDTNVCGMFSAAQLRQLRSQIQGIWPGAKIYQDIGDPSAWAPGGSVWSSCVGDKFADQSNVADYIGCWYYPFSSSDSYGRTAMIDFIDRVVPFIASTCSPALPVFLAQCYAGGAGTAGDGSDAIMPTAADMSDLNSTVRPLLPAGSLISWYVWIQTPLYSDYLKNHPELWPYVN